MHTSSDSRLGPKTDDFRRAHLYFYSVLFIISVISHKKFTTDRNLNCSKAKVQPFVGCLLLQSNWLVLRLPSSYSKNRRVNLRGLGLQNVLQHHGLFGFLLMYEEKYYIARTLHTSTEEESAIFNSTFQKPFLGHQEYQSSNQPRS